MPQIEHNIQTQVDPEGAQEISLHMTIGKTNIIPLPDDQVLILHLSDSRPYIPECMAYRALGIYPYSEVGGNSCCGPAHASSSSSMRCSFSPMLTHIH
jgi:hypothetical protein